jgi:8-oxo-dGTP pyrophosphatase MutT (NUDIX family)
MLEFSICARGLFTSAQVIIHYDPTLTMSHEPTIRSWMNAQWTQKLAEARLRQIPLYDAPLYRFVHAEVLAEQLHLTLGNTSYKEYVTTRTPAFALRFPGEELGNACSVCSVVETSDQSILLDKRTGVDVYEGRYHVIGGFFERTRDASSIGMPDPFAAMRREIHEETGILSADIAEQVCLGVVYDHLTPHAELCFLTRLRIPLATVQSRVPLDQEIKRLLPLHSTAEELRVFLLEHHGQISATGEPNLLLYGGWKYGETWFTSIMEQLLSSTA